MVSYHYFIFTDKIKKPGSQCTLVIRAERKEHLRCQGEPNVKEINKSALCSTKHLCFPADVHKQHTSIFCALFNVKTAGPVRTAIFHRSVQTVQVARQMETVAESFGFVRRAHPSLRSCLGKSGADGTKPLSVTSLEGRGFSLVATAGDTFFV